MLFHYFSRMPADEDRRRYSHSQWDPVCLEWTV